MPKTYFRSLCLTASFALAGCAGQQVKISDPTLNRDDCSVTQTTTVTEGKQIVSQQSAFLRFDENCSKHEKDMAKMETSEKARLIRLQAAADVLAIGFSRASNDDARHEYLTKIMANLSSDDEHIRRTQEKALVAQKMTQNDIIRAEVIDLIQKSTSDNVTVKQAALSEILNIHRRQKYPERYNIPRQIVEQELAERHKTIADIETDFSNTQKSGIATCQAQTGTTSQKKMIFVCR